MYEQGDIKYYYTMYVNGTIGYAKIECQKDSKSEISSIWKILEKFGDIGDDYEVGSDISADQLSGIGTYGLNNYIYSNKEKILVKFFNDYEDYNY